MTALRRFLACGLLHACAFLSLHAASSTWTDLQGNTFKAEPLGTYGPFALFKTAAAKGRRVLLRMLSPEDCVRFYKETSGAGKYDRASDWSKAHSRISADLKGRLYELRGDKLELADLNGKPEPELYVCFFASAWEGVSYELAQWYRATYDRLRRLYGDDLQTIYLGVRHDSNDGFIKNLRLPWYTVRYTDRASFDAYRWFAPAEGSGMVVLSREGVPLIVTETNNLHGMKTFVDELCALAGAADERNQLLWKDRAYYLANIRPIQFANSSAPAAVVWNPLRPSILRKHNVERVAAKLAIDVAGKVTSVELLNKDTLPATLIGSLEKAFQASFVFLPAIDHGQAVASSLDFEYKPPTETTETELDRDWVLSSGRKALPISNWLLLRPIPVPADDFSQVDHVEADGKAVMAAVSVGGEKVDRRAQMNAFKGDPFGIEGSTDLKPVAGQSVTANDQTFTWERYDAADGFVDMQGKQNCDYCVGYAWTEFDAGAGGPALLGLGSDDGMKIWLNGALVHDRWVVRPTQVDQDVVRLKLAPGRNTILVKIQNWKDGWSFLFRIRP